MRTKKNPKHTLENFSKIFFQIGLVFSLFVIYSLMEHKTYESYDKQLLGHVSMTDDMKEEIPIVKLQKIEPERKIPKTVEIVKVVEDEFIRVKHSISGVNQSPIELEVPRECIDDLFGSLGVDVYDKQRDDVCKIWKELDGMEFVDDDSLWEDIGIMLGDCSVGSNGWDYRMRSLNDELYEKVEELVHKHILLFF